MQGMNYPVAFHFGGTLAADQSGRFAAPFDMTLTHIQAVNTAASNATLLVGTTADDDAYMLAKVIGASETPAQWGPANFVGGKAIHIAKGTVIEWLLDYDGNAGTAAANVTILFNFTEG